MEIIRVDGNLTNAQLKKVVEKLKNGGIVMYPTETCYGIGAMCTSQSGVGHLIEYKERPQGKAISVAVATRKMAQKYVKLNLTAENIYANFLPGPYTVISKDIGVVDKRLVSEFSTLGIRIPNHPIPLQIVEALDEGITATSANISGGKTPYKISDLLDNISQNRADMIDLIIDYGELPKNPSSVVIDTTQTNPRILRGEDRVGLLRGQSISYTKLGEWISNSDVETSDFAGEIWSKLSKEQEKPLVLLLSGELGAGKTQFVKGLARELGVSDNILSPTFVFEHQYNTSNMQYPKLYHYDLWRMEGDQEEIDAKQAVESLGIEKALKGNNILAIEWPENLKGFTEFVLNKVKLAYKLEIDYKNADSRIMRLYEFRNV